MPESAFFVQIILALALALTVALLLLLFLLFIFLLKYILLKHYDKSFFLFRRSMVEGKIGTLKFVDGSHIERCKIYLCVTFHTNYDFLDLFSLLWLDSHFCNLGPFFFPHVKRFRAR